MVNGFVIIVRNKEDHTITVETTDDFEDYLDERKRLIYCQAVSDIDIVEEKVAQWLEDNHYSDVNNVNDAIAEMVSSIQWIANDHPLSSFKPIENNNGDSYDNM